MWHFLFGFSGRVSRASFCLFAALAFVALLFLLAGLWFYETTAGDYERGGPTPWPSTTMGMVDVGVWFACLFLILASALAVSAKRLHDRNKTAWWLIVFVLVPNALESFAQILENAHVENAVVMALALNLLSVGFFVWAFIELACLRGTTGPNQFGSDPALRASAGGY